MQAPPAILFFDKNGKVYSKETGFTKLILNKIKKNNEEEVVNVNLIHLIKNNHINGLKQEKKVKTLLDSKLPIGYHTLKFDASNFPSGLYFYIYQRKNTKNFRRNNTKFVEIQVDREILLKNTRVYGKMKY